MNNLVQGLEQHNSVASLPLVHPTTTSTSTLGVSTRANVRLRLLQAEEHLRQREWLKVEESLVSARLLLDRTEMLGTAVRSGMTERQKQCVQLHIEKNLLRKVTLSELSDLVGLSYSHFSRAFKQTFGNSAMRYIRSRRLERAKEIMLDGSLSLAEVAYECGLSDQAALCKLFRRLTGSTPSKWRRQLDR
jgi:AraC-like DNA-binding protein